MKVLIIGSGGRENALAWKLKQDSRIEEIHAIPGNPGIDMFGTSHSGDVEDIEGLLKFAKENKIDFTIVGPEVPLCLGIVDRFEEEGLQIFGPVKETARLEGSKSFAKEFMKKHDLPTAKYIKTSSVDEALKELPNYSLPVVIKADGLCAGKGVVIATTRQEAVDAIQDMMKEKTLGEAGSTIIIEEYLEGVECSLLCFIDGDTIIPMETAKDHKRIFENEQGANTGGMGTLSPNPFITEELKKNIDKNILKPILKAVQDEKMDYRGLIFIGLMVNKDEAKILEFNVRFGDPETQSILMRLKTPLIDVLKATSEKRLSQIELEWDQQSAVCVVLASSGYPGSYEKGKEITNLDKTSDVQIFHAGTKRAGEKILTNGGRVLNICALGESLEDARRKVYQGASIVDFEGKFYRKDI